MEMHSLLSLLEGFSTGAGLIIAIGAQNVFVLKQGIAKNQVFATALFCAFTDALLISIGVAGLGTLLTSSPILLLISKWGGAAFLAYYGFRSFRAVFTSQSLKLDKKGPQHPGLKQTLLILAALSFLNPHVYIDTVVLLGSLSAQFSGDQRFFFALGAILASFIWFFGMCYGARFLAPLFAKSLSWKILDFLIGCTMWGIALSLIM